MILGPDFSYDGILHTGDIAPVELAGNVDEAQKLLNQVMERVMSWSVKHGLDFATEKPEIVLLTRKKIPMTLPIQVGTKWVQTRNTGNYLGLMIDTKLTF